MAYLAVAVFALNCICFCVHCLWGELLVARCARVALWRCYCCFKLATFLIGFTSGRVNWFVKQFLIETQRCQRQQYVKVLWKAKWLPAVGNALHATWKELKLLEWNALAFLLATWQNAALWACLGDECWMAANRHSYWITNPITNNTAQSSTGRYWGVPEGACHGVVATDTIWHAAGAAIFTATARSIQWKFSPFSSGIFRFWDWDCLNLLKHFSHYTDDSKLLWFIWISNSSVHIVAYEWCHANEMFD